MSTSVFPTSVDTFKTIPTPTTTPTNLSDASDDTLSTRLQQHSDSIVAVENYLLIDVASNIVRNVASFGADPTGVADSTTAIQNACNFGGTVMFPAGTFKISSSITLPSGTYVGSGVVSTIITTTSPNADIFVINGQGVKITGIQFASSVTRTGGYYINSSADFNCITIDTFLMTAPFIGINFNFVGTIQNGQINFITPLGVGIAVTNGIGLISDIIFQGTLNSSAGIIVYATEGFFISHCQIFNQGYGLILSGQSGSTIDTVVVDNTIIDTITNAGILITCSSSNSAVTHTVISQTWVASCGSYGIACNTSSGGMVDSVLISTSRILHSGLNGIDVEAGVTNLQVKDCTSWYNGITSTASGIALGSGVSQFSIQGCKMGSLANTIPFGGPGNTGYGIALAGSNTNCIIMGNDLRGNGIAEQFGTCVGTFVNTNNI
jgi:Pectate lyase superfamily protein